MKPVQLPYHDGSRDCTPVKCILFFSENHEVCELTVMFTDNEDERLILKSELRPDWVLQQPKKDQSSMVDRFKKAMEKLGYQVSPRNKGSTFLSFNLEPIIQN